MTLKELIPQEHHGQLLTELIDSLTPEDREKLRQSLTPDQSQKAAEFARQIAVSRNITITNTGTHPGIKI